MRYIFVTLAVCSILAFGMVQSDAGAQSVGAADDVAAISELRKQFQERINAGDVTTAMTFFTDDAIYLQPGTDAVTGNAAIHALWQGTTDAVDVVINYRVTELEVDQDMAFLIGDVSFQGTPRSGGDTATDEGRYVWILRRGDSGWKIARYMRHRRH
jgi:ketosteroid isomerase-like protein